MVDSEQQTVAGNNLATHPCHKDSCGICTILHRGQYAAGNIQKPIPPTETPAASTPSSTEDSQPQVTTSPSAKPYHLPQTLLLSTIMTEIADQSGTK